MGTAGNGGELPDVAASMQPGSPSSREIREAANLIALGVSAVTGLCADAAGVLEAGAATSAREIARGAAAVSQTARDLAREAACGALDAANVVAEVLALSDTDTAWTPEQATVVSVNAGEASRQLGAAVEASRALTLATAAAELAEQAADRAVAFELHMVATAVAARHLLPAVTNVTRVKGAAESSSPE